MKNLEKQAIGIVAQLFDLAEVPVEKRQEINDVAYDYVTEQLIIADVSVSLLEILKDLTEVYEEREAKASKMGNWSEAFQNEIRVSVLQHLVNLHQHKNN